jgi:phosphatidylinositol alpha-mannosyltransferase
MVTEYAYPTLGGVSEHVHHLSRELVERGHEVTVITGRVGGRHRAGEVDRAALSSHGYRTVRIGRAMPLPSNGSIARMTLGPGLARALGRELAGADVVHAQGLVGARLALLAAARSQAPATVATYHTYVDGSHWAYRRFNRGLNGRMAGLDRRIAVSHACVDSLAPWFPGDYDVLPNGVDCARFHPGPRPDGAPRILFVGRLEPRNALADLLRAAALLAREGRRFTIQVAGDGPTRGVNERLADRLGIADRVEWHGMVHDELPRLYREATVMAAPCTLASFGVILIEALASGTPIVAADNAGFRQVIGGDVPGALTPMRDPAALAAALGAVIDDEERRSDWAVRGRAAALERFDWPIVARRVEQVYRAALAAAPTALPVQ